MNIRLATVLDLASVMELIAAVVPLMIAAGNNQWDDQYPNVSVFKKDIDNDQLWVAEIDGQLAGLAAITTDQEPEYAQVGLDINELAIVTHRLAVSPKYQGKGVAAALLNKAEEIATAKQIKYLRVDTNSKNLATQRLFPKLGYVFVGEINLGFREGLKFYCYEKQLAL